MHYVKEFARETPSLLSFCWLVSQWQDLFYWRTTTCWRRLPSLIGNAFQSVLCTPEEQVPRVSLKLPMISLISHARTSWEPLVCRPRWLLGSPLSSMSVAVLRPSETLVGLLWNSTLERYVVLDGLDSHEFWLRMSMYSSMPAKRARTIDLLVLVF